MGRKGKYAAILNCRVNSQNVWALEFRYSVSATEYFEGEGCLAKRIRKLLNRQLRFDFSRHAPYGPKWQI